MILFSILFDKVHIASGFMYMAAERILLGALGGLYEKRRSICGVVVIYYYIFGQVAVGHGCLV